MMNDPYQQIVDELSRNAPYGAGTAADRTRSSDEEHGTPPTSSVDPALFCVPAGFPRPPHETSLRYVYFDLEIKNSIEECGGWAGAIHRGGVAVLCVWDSRDENPVFYDETNLEAGCRHLEEADVVVSFNGAVFDVPLLEAHTRRKLVLKEHVDVFALAKRALERMGKGWKGQGLGPLSEKTTGRTKIGMGSHAPTLVREQKWADLYNYCLRDVILTRDLLTFARRNGYILDAEGEELLLDIPIWMKLGQNG